MFRKFAIPFLLILVPSWCYSKNSVRVIFNYDDSIPKTIVIEGKVNKKGWLGISFYPATFKDAIKECLASP